MGLLFVFAFFCLSCAKNDLQTFGEIKIEQIPLANRDVFVFKSVDENKNSKTEFNTQEPINFIFELSNTSSDTMAWLNYDQLANSGNVFIKIYTQGKEIGTPYKRIQPISLREWTFEPSSMVRISMTWINNDRAKNDYVSIASDEPMNNFLEKGDYSARIKFPLAYKKNGVTDTIECNRTIYFTINSKK